MPPTPRTPHVVHSHVSDAFGGTPDSGAPSPASPPSADEPGGDAGADLLKELKELVEQARPLAGKAVEIVRSNAELACFLAKEKTRLFVARCFVLLLAIAVLSLSWLFLSLFLWRFAIEIIGHWSAGPLVLLVTHGALGASLLKWRKRLKL